MMKMLIAAVALLMASLGLSAADQVELTGTYEIQVGCYGTYHEELSFIVIPGKDKFSGIRHALSLTGDQKKQLRSGSSQIKIRGKKQAAVTKKMTKGAVRKAMVDHIKSANGMPLHSKGMDVIISKISVAPAAQAGAHDHGDLQLQAVDDDNEVIDVTVMAHIVVESIEVMNP